MRRKKRKERWLANQQKKRMRRLSRQKKKHYSMPDKKRKVKTKKAPFRVILPENFSLSQNSSETINFFSGMIEIIKKSEKKARLFFDLSNVRSATPDAIMYFIALINNVRRMRILDIECSGNMPVAEQPRNVFEKVGFYNYVEPARFITMTKDPDRLKIIQGNEIDADIVSSICDFVIEKTYSSTLLSTKRLYPMLIELMSNVKQHAYQDNKGLMFPKWYIYVENCDKEIKFIFLDTGIGIPNTIRKNWVERIKDIFGADKDDATYIFAALQGQFRTETRQEHRGKGLPEIYNAVISENSLMDNLSVISGHGICKINCGNSVCTEYIDNSLDGSMFMWRFRKEQLL